MRRHIRHWLRCITLIEALVIVAAIACFLTGIFHLIAIYAANQGGVGFE